MILGAILVPNPPKTLSRNRSQIARERVRTIMPQGSQNGAEIGAKTHHKSIPKSDSKQGSGNPQKHVFLRR